MKWGLEKTKVHVRRHQVVANVTGTTLAIVGACTKNPELAVVGVTMVLSGMISVVGDEDRAHYLDSQLPAMRLKK